MATYRFMRTFTPSPDQNVLEFLRKRLDDFLGILERHMQQNDFAAGVKPTIADISMIAYLHYPADETGYDLKTSHPTIDRWLQRVAALPSWRSAYDLLPGQRLTHYV
jgi:glutathione S-transferase